MRDGLSVVEANTVKIGNPAFVEERNRWIRFGKAEAIGNNEGLFAGVSSPASTPRWFGDTALAS